MIRFARSIDHRFRVGYISSRKVGPLCTAVSDGRAVYGHGGVLFLGWWCLWWTKDDYSKPFVD